MSMGRPLDFDPLAEAQRQWLEHGWGQPVRMTAATALMRAQQIVLQRVGCCPPAARPHLRPLRGAHPLALLPGADRSRSARWVRGSWSTRRA